jgi:hypothetical protein
MLGDRLYYHAIETVDIRGVWPETIRFEDLQLILKDTECVDKNVLDDSLDWICDMDRKFNVLKLLKAGNIKNENLASDEYCMLRKEFRDQEYLDQIQECCKSGSADFDFLYSCICSSEEEDALSEAEALYLARRSILKKDFSAMQRALQFELITPTLELGLEFEMATGLEAFALHIYQSGRIMDKCITMSIKMDRYRDAAHGILAAYPLEEIVPLLRELLGKFGRENLAKVLVNLVIIMEFDGIHGESQGFYNQIGVLMGLNVGSRSDLLTKLGEIADETTEDRFFPPYP